MHTYDTHLVWTGNRGEGTSGYRAYDRAHEITIPGKPYIPGSSDPAFRGDSTRYNPEELLVASLSACHMLWYLHLCADSGISVTSYTDDAHGSVAQSPDGSGQFTEAVLHPVVRIAAGGDTGLATSLHERAHELCFIARSMNFPVRCEPRIEVETR